MLQLDQISVKKRYKIKIIEDCAEAIGTKYKKFVGSVGDISAIGLWQ